MVTKTRVSLDDFLARPETEPPSELIDGEVIQKVAPNAAHAYLTTWLIVELGNYLRRTREARLANELRHVFRPRERALVPDISVVALDKAPRGKDAVMRTLEEIPDFAIEVLSPGTSYPRTAEKVDFYMRSGTRLVWVVDPQEELVAVHRPGEPVAIYRPPDVIDALPVLKDFRLDLAALFGELHDGDEE